MWYGMCRRYGTGKHGIWYVTFAVWYHGTVSWMYFMANLSGGMAFSVHKVRKRVEYVVRISYVTTLYIDHWKVFENIINADRQTDRHVCIYRSWDSVLQTELQDMKKLKPFFLPVDTQHNQCPCRFFNPRELRTSRLQVLLSQNYATECVLHNNVVSLWRTFVTTSLVSL